ncbi:hypothetical protein [uncultured Clostridium sp.]|uniref:hypothetical protein n=1 Tax=Clostridium sp. TaxID=1506 RepID=UPI0025E29199|nr:hypothetical protein [uncultured Clostridium sp.]
MRIKIISLSVVREKNKNVGNNKKFRVKDIIINTDSESLQNYGEKSDILRCLKECIKENGNTIDYNEMKELVNCSNIIGNNFWNEDYFENTCRFECRDYFDFSECKFKYI